MLAQSAPPPSPSRHFAVGWTFWDLVFVIVAPLVLAILIGIAGGAALLAAGMGDLEARLQAEPVLWGMGLAGCVYALYFAAVAFVVRWRRIRWPDVGLRRPPLVPILFTPLIFAGQLFLIVVINLIVLSLTGSFENPQAAAITGGQGFSWRNYGLAVMVVGLLAPLVEELIFRGLIFGWLRARLPLWLAVVVSAAVFAGAHVIPVLLPALFAIGLVLAIVYQWTGSLWVTVLLHAMQNTFVVTLLFVALAAGRPV